MTKNRKIKILFLAQTPPPYHGQAIMLELLLKARYEMIDIKHIRLNYSDEVEEIGKFSLKKVFVLLRIISSSLIQIFLNNYDAIYYPPAGFSKMAIYRDIITLILLRPFAKKTIFHFHPIGLKDFYNGSSFNLRKLILRAYSRPDLAIVLSQYNKMEIDFLNPQKVAIIPNGIEDYTGNYSVLPGNRQKKNTKVNILFVGNLYESKGVKTLLDASIYLTQWELDFSLIFAGLFHNKDFERQIKDHPNYIRSDFVGLVKGEEKWNLFSRSDIFCFPTYYENENQPVVLIEAMQFSLPVVSTSWRGIPDMIEEGKTGFIVPPRDPEKLAESIKKLVLYPDLRKEMGANGRMKYEKDYTLENYYSRIESSVTSLFIS